MPTPAVIRRALFLVAWSAAVCAVIVASTGGVSWMTGAAALALTAALCCAWRFPRGEIEEEARWFERVLYHASPFALLVVIAAGCAIGVGLGSFAAGGSDSYGYVSQAGLWLSRQLRTAQPWVEQMSWPFRGYTFAPLGYRPMSGPDDGTIVPTYAPGLPILMAAFQAIGGLNGPYYVVPILGALALWFTYLLGREATGSRETGVIAAALLLGSPAFLVQIVQPMSDVPATAGWALVCLLALREPKPRAFAAGVAAGGSLLIRPNLALLAGGPISAWVWQALRHRELRRPAAMRIARFGVGLLPAVVAIGALNKYLYGSPLTSGYGSFVDLYSLAPVRENVRHYLLWVVQAHSVLIGLALVPFLTPRVIAGGGERSTSALACFVAMMALTFASYIFYYVFNDWSYLRFLLPALPMVFVLMAAAIRLLFMKLPVPVRACAAAMICAAAIAFGLRYAHDRYVFNLPSFEQRYVRAARYAVLVTPPNAVILSMQHSGSLRYYAHRITLRYDWVLAYRLDSTLEELREKGYRPYIVLDEWEEAEFRQKFASASSVGRLDWAPIVRVAGTPEVRIYDTEGRAGGVISEPAR